MINTYWYEYTIYTCPICGKTNRHKNRIYGILKPTDPTERYHISEVYDYCQEGEE